NGKTRPLGIPAMKCRAMQALHLLALEPIAETTADPNSYGFRPERSTADAAAQCFGVLSRKANAEWILEGDIQGCFDNISHDWLIANIPMDKAILQKWLNAGYIHNGQLFPSNAGTPQGGIISPVLSNMTLDGLEAMLAKRFPTAKWTGKKLQAVRYADDFIITGYSKEWLENEVRPAVVEFLAERGLTLSKDKTKITHIGNGFDFLGWNVRKYNGKLLIKPSKANISAHLAKLRELIKANKTIRQTNLIGLLNPVLRGWANYHSHVVAKKVFNQVDSAVWEMLWRWAVRRHPRKTRRWVKDRYFKVQGGRRWVFSCAEKSADGRKRQYTLLDASDTPIVRHIKIKAAANPHDPAWDEYFESRWGKRMLTSAKGRAKLYRIWVQQGGRCCVCFKPVTKDTPWHSRHIVKLGHGGTDAAANLEIYHLRCPRDVQFAYADDVQPGA
ncbi:group II intron reverse transcriptase/maturase, partial [Pseudomonas chengduensis]